MRLLGLSLAGCLLFFTGCVSLATVNVSSMNYDSASMEVLGQAKGECTYDLVCSVVPVADEDRSAAIAIERALTSVGGDALLNTVVDVRRNWFLYPLFFSERIEVYGTAVRFNKRPWTGVPTAPKLPDMGQEAIAKNNYEAYLSELGKTNAERVKKGQKALTPKSKTEFEMLLKK
jgi:hypothetical protein